MRLASARGKKHNLEMFAMSNFQSRAVNCCRANITALK